MKKTKDGDVVDIVGNASSVSFEFYATFLASLAVALEACVSGLAGHHVRAAFVYAVAGYTALLGFGYYFFRILTNRYDSYRTAYVLLHLPTFVCIIVAFIWAMVEQIVKA